MKSGNKHYTKKKNYKEKKNQAAYSVLLVNVPGGGV